MEKINKITIFQTLMSDPDYPYNSPEEGIIRRALMKESWITASPEEKQERRREFLLFGKNRKTALNLDYYERMIFIYDIILAMLSKLGKILNKGEAEEKSVELPLFRIIGLLLVEQGFIDEDILPAHHIGPKTFQKIADELHAEYPNLNLKEFSEKYTEMFESWPDKTKYEIKKS